MLSFLILMIIISPDLMYSATKLNGIKAITENNFLPVSDSRIKLGRLLFYDKVLSGNRNISCGTCHHHDQHGADGLSLGVGEGGSGIGLQRLSGKRIHGSKNVFLETHQHYSILVLKKYG